MEPIRFSKETKIKVAVAAAIVWAIVGVVLLADGKHGTPPATAAVAATTVLPASFTGQYDAKAGEDITAAGPLRNVTIRVPGANVTIHDIDFYNAKLCPKNGDGTTSDCRPATIYGTGASNLKITNVTIHGDSTQQNQAIYLENVNGATISGGSCIDPGMDQYFDHCAYINNSKNVLIQNWTARAAHGADVHVYSGGSTVTVDNADLGRAAWNVVSWGSGNVVTVKNSKLHDAIQVSGGRGYAAEAASSGKITISNTCTANAQTVGNVSGHRGWNTQGGGTITDAGGNTFKATAADCGSVTPPPPPPPAQCADGLDNDGDTFIDLADPGCANAADNDETNAVTPPPPVATACNFTALDQHTAAISDAETKAALVEVRKHLALLEHC